MNLKTNVIYHVSKLDKNGKEIAKLPPRKNLITNVGMDGLATRTFAASFTHLVLGTGARQVRRNSGSVTATMTAGVVTSSDTFFESADEGRTFKFYGLGELRIVTFTNSTTVVVETIAGGVPSNVGSATAFNIFYTNSAQLETEFKRSSTYSTDVDANGATYFGGVYTIFRTFIGSIETAPRVYTEMGWSHTATAGANLFGRDLLPVGFPVNTDEQIKVKVEINITVSPIVPVSVGDLTGASFDTTGQGIIHHLGFTSGTDNVIQGVSSTGAVSGSNALLEPSVSKCFARRSSDFTLPSDSLSTSGTNFSTSGIALTGSTYVSGRFERFYSLAFTVGQENGNWFGFYISGATTNVRPQFLYKFSTVQVKTSDYRLNLSFRLSWNRVLVD
jgi:hypothetical protein